MASLTRGGVELLAFGRQFPTLGQGRQPDVDLTPVLQALGAPLPAPAPAQAPQQGHRPVLQVTKVDAVAETVFGQTRTRHKLWLSDGDRWVIGYALQLEGASAGCLVRVTNYSSNFELIIHEMEIVGQPQPLIGAPKSMPMGKPLPNDAIQPPSLPPPPSVAEIEARLAAATVSAAPTATPTTASAAPTTTISAATSAVELDVGGAPFKTTLATLSRHPHTFFAALARNHGDATGPIRRGPVCPAPGLGRAAGRAVGGRRGCWHQHARRSAAHCVGQHMEAEGVPQRPRRRRPRRDLLRPRVQVLSGLY